jgi:hypothetical protein
MKTNITLNELKTLIGEVILEDSEEEYRDKKKQDEHKLEMDRLRAALRAMNTVRKNNKQILTFVTKANMLKKGGGLKGQLKQIDAIMAAAIKPIQQYFSKVHQQDEFASGKPEEQLKNKKTPK